MHDICRWNGPRGSDEEVNEIRCGCMPWIGHGTRSTRLVSGLVPKFHLCSELRSQEAPPAVRGVYQLQGRLGDLSNCGRLQPELRDYDGWKLRVETQKGQYHIQ